MTYPDGRISSQGTSNVLFGEHSILTSHDQANKLLVMAITTQTTIGRSFQQNHFRKLDVVASFVTTMSFNYFTSILRAIFLATMLHPP